MLQQMSLLLKQALNERFGMKRLHHKNFTDGVLRADIISTSGTETVDRFFDLKYAKFVEFNTRTQESFSIPEDVVMANGVDYAEYKDIFVAVFNYSLQFCILYK